MCGRNNNGAGRVCSAVNYRFGKLVTLGVREWQKCGFWVVVFELKLKRLSCWLFLPGHITLMDKQHSGLAMADTASRSVSASASASISLAGSFLDSASLTRASSDYSLHIQDDASPLLDVAIRNIDLILSNQTKAMSVLTSQYRNSEWSINQMKTSLRLLNNSLKLGGKIVISGMGKSFKIASKTVATLNSLRMHSALLHPSEALHGDLGMIREDHYDSMIIISASGNSGELLTMLEHTPPTVPIILMTCNKDSTLSRHPKVVSLLLAEIPTNLSETNLYGLSAPTISTTVCLTMLDAVSIALSELHISDFNTRKNVFGTHHPGGAIGMDYQLEKLKLAKLGGLSEQEQKQEQPKEELKLKPLVVDKTIEASEQSSSGDSLNIADLVFIKKIQDTPYKTETTSLPDTELELLRLITTNDYIICQQSVIDCNSARDMYRECISNGTSWKETRWQIESVSIPYPM